MKQGKEYETTLLGRLLSVSCLTRIDGGSSAEFFDRPTRLSQPEVDNTESMIYQVSDTLLLFMSFLWKKNSLFNILLERHMFCMVSSMHQAEWPIYLYDYSPHSEDV